jgi:hypothetical protein
VWRSFKDVVYAALQAIVRIGVIVDADKQSPVRCARGDRFGYLPFAQVLHNCPKPGLCLRSINRSLQKNARLWQPGNLAPDFILCVCVPNVLDRIVISDSG